MALTVYVEVFMKFTIVDPTTMRTVLGTPNWRDRMACAQFHGKTFTKEEMGEFLAHECALRGNKESTQKFVRTQPFNFLRKRGVIIPVFSDKVNWTR